MLFDVDDDDDDDDDNQDDHDSVELIRANYWILRVLYM